MSRTNIETKRQSRGFHYETWQPIGEFVLVTFKTQDERDRYMQHTELGIEADIWRDSTDVDEFVEMQKDTVLWREEQRDYFNTPPSAEHYWCGECGGWQMGSRCRSETDWSEVYGVDGLDYDPWPSTESFEPPIYLD